MHIALFAGLMAMLALTGLDSQSARYDAPVPQKCATFQDRYDVRNKVFCDDWMHEHKLAKDPA